MYILIDVYGKNVICNEEYKTLEEAKTDLDVEFWDFVNGDNVIEYGNHCYQAEDGMSAWARLKGVYRVWQIVEVLP